MEGAIPGMVGVDHVGFNVPDLEQALAFFIDVLGCELLDRQARGPFSGASDTTVEVAMLRYDPHTVFELLEFHGPDMDQTYPGMTGTGGYHLALTVADLDAALTFLRSHGIDLAEAPPLPSGRRRAFFRAPWGMNLQIITAAEDAMY